MQSYSKKSQQYFCLRCEDLAEIIWANRQQIRQLEMIQEGLNIPPQVRKDVELY